jgi:hypothetical protein
MGWTARVRFPAGARFSPLHSVHVALGPSQFPIQGVPAVVSQGVNRQGREADHSPPSSVEVKNGEATSSLPHTYLWHDN